MAVSPSFHLLEREFSLLSPWQPPPGLGVVQCPVDRSSGRTEMVGETSLQRGGRWHLVEDHVGVKII